MAGNFARKPIRSPDASLSPKGFSDADKKTINGPALLRVGTNALGFSRRTARATLQSKNRGPRLRRASARERRLKRVHQRHLGSIMPGSSKPPCRCSTIDFSKWSTAAQMSEPTSNHRGVADRRAEGGHMADPCAIRSIFAPSE